MSSISETDALDVSRPNASAAAVLLAELAARPAIAQEESAIAEQLFRDGRDLLDRGQIAQACEKFASSERLAPAIGTRLNLALCREKQGRTATAWSLYAEVEAQAQRAGDAARAQFAHDHGTALAGQLRKIVIDAASPPAGMVIKLDGTACQAASWAPKSHLIRGTTSSP